MELSLNLGKDLSIGEVRELILSIEEKIIKHPLAVSGKELEKISVVEHCFSQGIYTRKCRIPKGQVVVGKIHRHDHPVFLLKGRATVLTETGGVEELQAPYFSISPAGTKRVLITHEDTEWITTHSNPDDCRDIVTLEKRIVALSYSELEGVL